MQKEYHYKFELESDEELLLEKWLDQHDIDCKFGPNYPYSGGAIGGRLTYSFTPTSLGVVTVIKCACGGEVNVTDYGSW